jgi:hypothetical protein
MLARQAVETVRSMLQGASLDEISVLAAPYTAGTDTTLTLKYAKRNLVAGSTVCAGLNTFTVMAVSTDGLRLDVLPSADGGPDLDLVVGEIVRVRPKLTTWAIFREIQSEIDSMSAPMNGLFWPWRLDHYDIDYVSGIYTLPLSTDGPRPFRLLRSEFRVRGTDAWVTFTDAEYVREANYVRVLSNVAQADAYRFTMAVAFGQMRNLDSELVDLGVTNSMADIPIFGAASTLALSWEGQRVQPISQGPTRRASEVQVTSNASLSQRFKQRQQEAITEEQSRVLEAFGYRLPLTYGYEQRVIR